MIKMVIDTNVALTGFLSFTKEERRIINYALQKKISLIGSEETLAEFVEKIEDNSHFRKVAKDFMFPKSKLIQSYKALVRLVTIDERVKNQQYCPKDPDDDMFVKAALSSDTKILVTHDKHLLELSNIEGIRVVKPRLILKILSLKLP